MSNVTRTTVYLDTADYRRLKALAKERGGTAAELIREAIAEYMEHRGGAEPASIGAGHSGGPGLSEEAEDRLEGFGRG